MSVRATIVCVNVGDKYPMETVSVLFDMVARHLPEGDYKFCCVTDKPAELPKGVVHIAHDDRVAASWWQKIKLFDPDNGLSGRCLYFDLDVAITGRLDALLEKSGIIADWHYPSYNSSVISWVAGEHNDIWQAFDPVKSLIKPSDWPHIWTDQDFIYTTKKIETFKKLWCVSYRSHATKYIPSGAMVVCFHGEPKPWEVKGTWVEQVYAINGLTELPISQTVNVEEDTIDRNIKTNSARKNVKWLDAVAVHGDELVLIGGGPSVARSLSLIRARKKRGASVMAVNGAAKYLHANKIAADVLVILDSRPENISFLDGIDKRTFCLIASGCDPALFDTAIANGNRVVLWHSLDKKRDEEYYMQYFDGRPVNGIWGGSTVMQRALVIALFSGFRKMHVYGMDSSFEMDKHHAYEQALNNADRPLKVFYGEKHYYAAPWMIQQAKDFQEVTYPPIITLGGNITVHGDGLIPDICRFLNKQQR